MRALGRIGDPSSVPAVAKLMTDESHEVRKAAYPALGAIGGEASARAIHPRITALASEIQLSTPLTDPRLQEAKWANAALATIASPGSIAVLDPLLDSQNWELSRDAGTAIEAVLEKMAETKSLGGRLDEILKLIRTRGAKAGILSRAFAAIRASGDEAAIDPLHELLKDRDSNIGVESAKTLGVISTKSRSAGELKKRLRDLERQRGSSAILMYWCAYSMAKLGDYSKVRVVTKSYDERLKKDDDDADAHMRLGWLFLDVGLPKEAMKGFSRALRIRRNPKLRADALIGMAVTHAYQGDVQKAEDKLEEAVKLGAQLTPALIARKEVAPLQQSENAEVRSYYEGLRLRIEQAERLKKKKQQQKAQAPGRPR